MSQIINAIPPNALLPVAGAMVGWVGHMLWFRAERAHVTRGMGLIRQFMRGNDDWEQGHKTRFALSATPDVTGELVHVQVDDPQIADGLARLADEVGLVQALNAACCDGHGDEPCTPDAGYALPCCGDCPDRNAPAEHDVDEDAPADDTERAYLWVLVVVALLMAPWAWSRRQGGALWAYLSERFQSDESRAAEWLDDDPYDRYRQATDTTPPPVVPEPVEIVHVNRRYRSPGMTGQYPLVKVVGDRAAGRHRREPEPEMPAINIPAQRDGEVEA